MKGTRIAVSAGLQAMFGWSMRTLVALLLLAAAPGWTGEAPDSMRIGSIDFYGVRSLNADELRRALPLHEGDVITRSQADAFERKMEQSPQLKGVAAARVSFVCCEEHGGLSMFIGVREPGSAFMQFRPAPTGAVRLPADLLNADAAAMHAVMSAVQAGHAEEDDTQGHMLLKDPDARSLQEKLIPLANRDLLLLRRVLQQSGDAGQRAAAARLLGYVADKQAVVGDLVQAMSDPDEGVRNDAMRALSVFVRAEKNAPRVPFAPFVALLESPVWTDVNKASFGLAALTASRDPQMLAALRARALPALVEIARWHSRGHALLGYQVVARIAGVEEGDAYQRWQQHDEEKVIRAALASGNPR